MHLKLLKDFPAYYEAHISLHSDRPFAYALLLLCHVLRAKSQIRSAQSQVYGCPEPSVWLPSATFSATSSLCAKYLWPSA